MDFTMYLHKQLKAEPYQGVPIAEIYVDETQDFSLGQIFLLARLTSRLFCAGDAAQCIVPGISFRFSDLQAELWRMRNKLHVLGGEEEQEDPFSSGPATVVWLRPTTNSASATDPIAQRNSR